MNIIFSKNLCFPGKKEDGYLAKNWFLFENWLFKCGTFLNERSRETASEASLCCYLTKFNKIRGLNIENKITINQMMFFIHLIH